MDVLTHAVIGASVAQLPLGSAISSMSFKQRALVGSVAAIFPDIDYLLFPLNPLEFLAYWHRAETHSIVLAPLWALLLTLGWRLVKGMRKHGLALFWISLAGQLSHTVIDVLSMYGTQWLAPLNSHRFSMNLLFVIDGYFTFCALIVMSVLLFKQTSKLRWLVMIVPITYLSLVYQVKHQAHQQVVINDQRTGLNSIVTLLPQPFSPFYWQVIHQKHDDIDRAYLRLADDAVAPVVSALLGKPSQQDHYQLPDDLKWHRFSLFPEESPGREMANEVWTHESFKAFQDFATYPVFYRHEDENQGTCIWFSDLRYHWPNAIPPFRFGMCKNEDQDWKLYRLRYFSHEAVKVPEIREIRGR